MKNTYTTCLLLSVLCFCAVNFFLAAAALAGSGAAVGVKIMEKEVLGKGQQKCQ
jgi:hypothetical protein